MAESNDNIRQRIEDSKLQVENRLAVAKVAARKLMQANAELVAAEEYRDLKGNSKAAARHAVAENIYNECMKDFISFFKAYENEVESTLLIYDELIAAEDSRSAKKTRGEAEKFETQQGYQKDNLWDSLDAIAGLTEAYNAAPDSLDDANDCSDETGKGLFSESVAENEEDAASAPKIESVREPSIVTKTQGENHTQQGYNPQNPYAAPGYAPYGAYNPYYQPQANVSIAPTSIDISPIIEEAVAAAMNKFKSVFERRADELSEAASSAIVTTDKIVKSESEIAEAEALVASKLAELTNNLKKLTEDLSAVAESCEKLIEVERDIAERQRRVNDMQRTLVREMQGVQANQKVITGEQAALTEAQATLVEMQSANTENHKLILAAEGEVSDMQKSLLEAQTAIGESVREVVNSHKTIVSAEQSIISANAKNIELQRELAEKQAELLSLQKSAMSEHKALMRKARSQNKSE